MSFVLIFLCGGALGVEDPEDEGEGGAGESVILLLFLFLLLLLLLLLWRCTDMKGEATLRAFSLKEGVESQGE